MKIILFAFDLFHQYVLSLVFFVMSFFSSKIKKRIQDELDFSGDSHVDTDGEVIRTYEFSSEGEFQQVYALFEEDLNAGKKTELLFCSSSAIGVVRKLNHPLLSCRMLPLLTHGPYYGRKRSLYSWSQSKELVLCRYDFFPHLLLLGLKKEKMSLVNAAMTSNKSFFYRFFLRMAYPLFHHLSFVSEEEKEKFLDFMKREDLKVSVCDLRILSILKRKEKKTKRAIYLHLENFFEREKEKKKVIWGNFWSEDYFLLDGEEHFKKDKKRIHFIVPHDTSNEAIENDLKYLEYLKNKYGCSFQHLKEDTSMIEANCSIYYLPLRGILLELYSFFDFAYVGGGYKKEGIHSLYEPFFSGCLVICGPNIHRSVEYNRLKSFAVEGLLMALKEEESKEAHCQQVISFMKDENLVVLAEKKRQVISKLVSMSKIEMSEDVG